MPQSNNKLTFNISLTVLNSLGRNLYRDFITVLGEAVSNAWDADATLVDIKIDRNKNEMVIIDNGTGMSFEDFTTKFLKIGYSKRRSGKIKSDTGRPFIGRKGIGKLALLSCAERVTIASKASNHKIIGGTIDNSALDAAIKDDLNQEQYTLEELTKSEIDHLSSLEHGTAIHFTGLKNGITNTIDYIRKSIALYFRFSLLDSNFKILLNNKPIDFDDLSVLTDHTEFLWNLNSCTDPLAQRLLLKAKENKTLTTNLSLNGFIASIDKPRKLKIFSTDEKVGIDLFVNGRLRERNMLKHVQSARIPESYLYGQIHFDELDTGLDKDRFTSSREGVIANDELFQEMISELRTIIQEIINTWDKLRLKHQEKGDDENTRISPQERASRNLYNETSKKYTSANNLDIVQKWINDFEIDASFNLQSYAECFIAENLVRKYIESKGIPLTSASNEINKWRKREANSKAKANISIQIRSNESDQYYLDMGHLCSIADPQSGSPNHLVNDEHAFTPLRDAVMHTSRLTKEAKKRLSTVYDNIRVKVKGLIAPKG